MQLWHLLSTDWQDALLAVKPDLAKIGSELAKSKSVNPEPEKIFAALGNSPKEFRVVIVGQDPYPNSNHAMGLAFSIPSNQLKIPPSLRNIQKEFADDLGLKAPNDLTIWRDSGVLLINRILTCESGIALSHSSLGWQKVTAEIVNAVLKSNPNAVGVLWGNSAQELSHCFLPEFLVSSVHPSPLSANRTTGKDSFFGSKPFSRVNQLLVNSDQLPIKWA